MRGRGRRLRVGVTPFALSSLLILLSASLLAVYVAHVEVERERRERRAGEIYLQERRIDEVHRELEERLREWMEEVAGEEGDGALEVMGRDGVKKYKRWARNLGVSVRSLSVNFSLEGREVNFTASVSNSSEVPVSVGMLYTARGEALYFLHISGGGWVERRRAIYVSVPRPGVLPEVLMEGVAEGAEELERILSYILTVISEVRILSGRGFVEKVEGNLLSEGELKSALAASLTLYLASRVRRISSEAIEEMSYYVTGRMGEGARIEEILEMLKGKVVDPASFYLSLVGLSERWFDPATLISATLYAMADQLLLKYLEYMGVLPSLERVISFLKRTGKEVMSALRSIAGFLGDLLADEGSGNPSLDYLREILVERAGLESRYFLKLMVEDRSKSRYSTYRGEVIDSWPSLPLQDGSGEREIIVVLTSRDTSTWVYDGDDVVGYRARVYRLSFSLSGVVEFPFTEVDASSSPLLQGLLNYVEDREEGGLSSLFMELIDSLVERVLSSPGMQEALSPYYSPLVLNPAVDSAPARILERVRGAMAVVRERARQLSRGLDDIVRQLIVSSISDLPLVVQYLNEKYDDMVGRDEQISSCVRGVVSSLRPQHASFRVLDVQEVVVDELTDSDLIISTSFPASPPSSVVLDVALHGGVRQESIRDDVEGWVESLAERAYSMVKEREVGSEPQGVLVQAIYSSFDMIDVDEVLDLFFGGGDVERPIIEMATDFALLSMEEYTTSLERMGAGVGVYIPEEGVFWEVLPIRGYPPIKPHILTLTHVEINVDVVKWSESGVHATDPGKISTMPFSTAGSLKMRVSITAEFKETSPYSPGIEVVEKRVEFNVSGGYFYLSSYPVRGVEYSSSDTFGEDLWEAIKSFFAWVWGKLKEPLERLWGVIKDTLSYLMKWVRKVIDGSREVISLINSVINRCVEVAREMVEELFEKATDLLRRYILGEGSRVFFKTKILSFTLVVAAKWRASPGEDLLTISLLKGPFNATFHQVSATLTRTYPTIDILYSEGKTSLKTHIDPTQSEGGPVYLIEGPLYIKGHGGMLHLEGPTPLVYRRAEITLSGVLKRKPQIPIPPLDAVAEIDLGVRMDYILSPQTGVYLNEYGRDGWIELYNPGQVDLTGFTVRAGGRSISVGGAARYTVVRLPRPLGGGEEVVLRDRNGTVLDSFTLPGAASYSRIVDGAGRWIEQGETRGRSNSVISGGGFRGTIIGIVTKAIKDAWDDAFSLYGFSFRTLKKFSSLAFKYVKERVLAAIEDLVLKIYFFFEIIIKETSGAAGAGAIIAVGLDGRGVAKLLEWIAKSIKRVLDHLLGRPETSPPPHLEREILKGTWLSVAIVLEGGMKTPEGEERNLLLSLSLNVPALRRILGMKGTEGWEVRFGVLMPNLSESEAEKWGVEVGEDERADLYFLMGSFRSRSG